MNSELVDYGRLSPNHSGARTHTIDRITPHCVVGQCSVETLGQIFAPTSRQASCNYGIGVEGRVGLYVDEDNRSWCSSSNENDQRAVTIECASDTNYPYAFNEVVYNKLVTLCIDICKRHGKNKLLWFSDKDTALSFEPAENEMVLTVHRWFSATSCPGDWMMERMGDLANKVTSALNPVDTNSALYHVQIGAFKVEDNAIRFLNEVKGAGFSDAFVKNVDGYFKVQIGAFKNIDNANRMLERAKEAGFADAFISHKGMVPVKTISVGMKVKVNAGATTYDGVGLASFVYDRIHTVISCKNDRAVIGYDGTVVAAVNTKDLTIV